MHKCAIINMVTTNLKSVSSMKLHRDLGITQKSACFMLHRIGQAYEVVAPMLDGPVKTEETFVGGKERNRQAGRTNYPSLLGIYKYCQQDHPRKGRGT